MENATKALMIAAAVLVAILVISLGIGIFNNASEQANSGNLDEYEVKAFNDKFLKYAGTDKKGSEVNALITTVFNHNMAQEEDAYKVSISGEVTVGINDTTAPSKVATGQTYSVEITMGADGLVESIEID